MKTLIAEDEFTSRLILQEIMKQYGPVDIAMNGKEAVEIVAAALKEEKPYDLICMDIMMPEMDGKEALQQIRTREQAKGLKPAQGAKIIMTTALDDVKNVNAAFWDLADAYLVKPIDKAKLLGELRKMKLIK